MKIVQLIPTTGEHLAVYVQLDAEQRQLRWYTRPIIAMALVEVPNQNYPRVVRPMILFPDGNVGMAQGLPGFHRLYPRHTSDAAIEADLQSPEYAYLVPQKDEMLCL